MTSNIYRTLKALITNVAVLSVGMTAAAQQMPQTTKETIPGKATVTTEVLQGTVAYVEGNQLVVRMSNGDIRYFTPPASRRFIIDGKELTVRDLKPGTKLSATVTSTTTSVTERTRTVGTGTVWYVAGTTVILTLPNGENRTYKVKDDYRFNVDGRPATVFDLRKGMRIRAEKIVEEPTTIFASDVAVTGQAPPPAPKPVVAQAPPPPPPPVRQVAAAPAPAPEPPPAPAPAAAPEPVGALPSSGSSVPLVGLLGLLFTGAGLGLRRVSRR